MKREDVSRLFNSLPKEYRKIIIANDLDREIDWLEKEKKKAIEAHAKNMKRYNEKIKDLIRRLYALDAYL